MIKPLRVVDTSWDRRLIVDSTGRLIAEVPIDGDASDETLDRDTAIMDADAAALAEKVNLFDGLVEALGGFLYLGFDTENLRRRVDPGSFREIMDARRVYDLARSVMK